MPIAVKIRLNHFPFILFHSSCIITGIEQSTKPKKRDDTAYIFFSKKAVSARIARSIPTAQPANNFKR